MIAHSSPSVASPAPEEAIQAKIHNFLKRGCQRPALAAISNGQISSQFLSMQASLADIANLHAHDFTQLRKQLINSTEQGMKVVGQVKENLNVANLRSEALIHALKSDLVLAHQQIDHIDALQKRLDTLMNVHLHDSIYFEQQISKELFFQQSIQQRIREMEKRYKTNKQKLELLQQGLFSLKLELESSDIALLEIAQQEALLTKSMAELEHAIEEYKSRNSNCSWLLVVASVAAIAVCTLLMPPLGAAVGGEVVGVAAGSEVSLGLVLSSEGASLSITTLAGAVAGGAILASTKDKASPGKAYAMLREDHHQSVSEDSKEPAAKESGCKKSLSQKIEEQAEKIAFKQVAKQLEQKVGKPAGNLMRGGYYAFQEDAEGSLSPYRDKILKGSVLLAQSCYLPYVTTTAKALDSFAKFTQEMNPDSLLESPAMQESFKKCLENASTMSDCEMHTGVQLAMMKEAQNYLGKPAEFLKKVRQFGSGHLISLCDNLGLTEENILEFFKMWAKSIDEMDLYMK